MTNMDEATIGGQAADSGSETMLRSKMKINCIAILFFAFGFLLFFAPGYGEAQTCDTSNLVNAYSAGASNTSLKINFDDRLYEIIEYQDNRYLLIDPNNCSLVLDKWTSKELIKARLYLQNPNLNQFLETYRTLRDCHSIAMIAKPACSVTNASNNFLDSATAKAITYSGNAIPDTVSELAPYGWKTYSRVAANGVVKFVKKGSEIQVAIELAGYASCKLSSSAVAEIYDYSSLAYNIGTESNSGNFYSNSTTVLSVVNDVLLNYLEISDQKYDFLYKLNSELANFLNHDCSAIDDKLGKIYSNITDASAFYKSVEPRSIDISNAYIDWIDKIKSEADESMNNLKNHPKGGESNPVYLDAKNDYNKGLYRTAKNKSNDAIRQLNTTKRPPPPILPPDPYEWCKLKNDMEHPYPVELSQNVEKWVGARKCEWEAKKLNIIVAIIASFITLTIVSLIRLSRTWKIIITVAIGWTAFQYATYLIWLFAGVLFLFAIFALLLIVG